MHNISLCSQLRLRLLKGRLQLSSIRSIGCLRTAQCTINAQFQLTRPIIFNKNKVGLGSTPSRRLRFGTSDGRGVLGVLQKAVVCPPCHAMVRFWSCSHAHWQIVGATLCAVGRATNPGWEGGGSELECLREGLARPTPPARRGPTADACACRCAPPAKRKSKWVRRSIDGDRRTPISSSTEETLGLSFHSS